MRGKIILIEGTDCSGKETQSKLLKDRLEKENIKCIRMSFPDYESPTGKIVGGPYLGKEYICPGWFDEGASNVSAKVSSLYYGADFLYHLDKMNDILDSGVNIILDRYFYSSFAHQGGKETNKDKRLKMYKWLETLFLDLLNLPNPDIKVFLHMPFDVACILKKDRLEKPDQNEISTTHLKNAEKAYIELTKLYNFKEITCSKNNKPKTIEEINDELYNYVIDKIK